MGPLSDPPLPLDGVLVVSCEQAVAAPLATRHLADLGARVIKIERPGRGDFARDYDTTVRGLSSHFVWLNRSKQSVALDLKDPDGIAALRRIVARADVFVQNFAPGAAERLGLGSDELRREHPRLITCSVSGYGSDGPYRDAKAYDLLIQSETGLVSVTGSEEHPAKAGIPAADIGAGMYAFSGILAALYERERTGEGSAFEVSLFDALTEWMGFPLQYTAGSGRAPRRAGTSHAAIAPYGAFVAGDGTEVVLAVQNEREWARFCADVLGDEALATDERYADGSARLENRPALHDAIHAVFAGLDGDEVVRRLAAAGVANARRRDLPDVLEHPQLVERGRWSEVSSPAGPVAALLPPIILAGREPRLDPIPDVGEHTDAVLAEFADGPTAVAVAPGAASGPEQPAPPGWPAPTHAHRFTVAAPRDRVWAWLNDPATFTDTQVGPFRVEFLGGGFVPGVVTTHHGPLLHLPGVIGEVREGEYRDLRYLYGAFAVSFRLLRPTRLQFELADGPSGGTVVEVRTDAHVHPRAARLWGLSQRLFWRRFETWARRTLESRSR